jgi:hypothetical protein
MIDQLTSKNPGLLVTSQYEWLKNRGIDELVDEGNKYWDEHKSAPDIAAMKMHSRVNEVRALISETGLGSFTALEITRQG